MLKWPFTAHRIPQHFGGHSVTPDAAERIDHWIPIADLRKANVGDITSVVVSPDGRWIAFAATPAVK